MATSSGLILATIYNQSQLTERKHVTRYWSIVTAATAVPSSPHLSAITKLAAALLGGRLFGGSVLPAQYCPCEKDCTNLVFTDRSFSQAVPTVWNKLSQHVVSDLANPTSFKRLLKAEILTEFTTADR